MLNHLLRVSRSLRLVLRLVLAHLIRLSISSIIHSKVLVSFGILLLVLLMMLYHLRPVKLEHEKWRESITLRLPKLRKSNTKRNRGGSRSLSRRNNEKENVSFCVSSEFPPSCRKRTEYQYGTSADARRLPYLMPCLSPLRAFQYVTPNDNGKREVTFNRPRNHLFEEVLLPCGKCLGCKLEYSRQWAVRCVHEASLNGDRNMFLTLTFDSKKVSDELTYSLEKKLFVDFLKRFRFRCGKLRYFHCGEYGSLNLRPHHHAIIFGYRFMDLEPYIYHCGSLLYRSKTLEELWPFGFSSVGDVTFESCAYVARYVTKKLHDFELGNRMPEYVTMSRKPGIGGIWIEKYLSDVYSQDRVIVRHGVQCRPPRFYDAVYARQEGEFALEKLKLERKLRCDEKSAEVDRLDLEIRHRALSRALLGTPEDLRSVCNSLLSAGQGSRERNKIELTISRLKLLPRELDLIEV